MNFNRDGQGNHRINKGKVNYWPNRFDAVPPTKPEDGGFSTFPEKVEGMKVRLKSKKFGEHFDQAQLFYNSMSPHEKAHILAAFGFELDHCDDPIVYNRICQRLTDIDLEMAKSVSELVGGPELKTGRANKGMQAKGLSQTDFAPKTPTIATRRVAIIIGEGFDATEYYSMKAALTTAQAMPFTIGTKRAPIQPEGSGKPVMPDHHLEGQRSTMFDAVFIPGGAHIKLLAKNGRAIHWVREAFAHCKAIAGAGTGVGLVELAIAGLPQVQTSGMSRTRNGSGVVESYGVVTGGSLGSAEGEDYEKSPVKIISGASDFIGKFFYAISQHRNYQRETDGLVEMLAY
jgi:catalase